MADRASRLKTWTAENPWKILGFFAALVTLVVSIHPMLSPDVYMYVAIAENWLKHGRPYVDPFIVDPVKPFQIMHEWLSYFVFWGIEKVAGFDGTIIFKACAFATMSLVVTREAKRWSTRGFVFVIALGLAIFSAHYRMSERTSIFSDLFQLVCLALALRLYALEKLDLKRTCAAVFLLFALWTNLHAGWLFGIAIVGVGVAARIVRDRSEWKFGSLVAAALAGLFVHPEGVSAVMYPFEFSSALREMYSNYYVEWAPIYVELLLNFVEVKVFLVFTAIFVVTNLFASAGKSLADFAFVAVLIALVVGPTFVHSRFVVVSAFGLAMITCYVFRDRPKPSLAEVSFGSVAAVATVVFFFVWPIPKQASPVALGVDTTLMATTTLDELGRLPEGNVFNSHEFGGAIAWRYGGRYKVVFHGFDTDPDRFLKDFFPAFESEAACLRAVEKYRIRYFLLDRHGGAGAIWKMLEKHGWKIRAYDSAAVLLTSPADSAP